MLADVNQLSAPERAVINLRLTSSSAQIVDREKRKSQSQSSVSFGGGLAFETGYSIFGVQAKVAYGFSRRFGVQAHLVTYSNDFSDEYYSLNLDLTYNIAESKTF